jgi:multiple sugar transport system permease protein
LERARRGGIVRRYEEPGLAVAAPRPTTRLRDSALAGRLREAAVGYAFVLVPMGFFLAFYVFPIVYAFYISAFDWSVLGKEPGSVASLKNYRNLGLPFGLTNTHDIVFWRAMKNTIEYTAVVVPSQMALGLFLALLVNQKIRGRAFFRAGFYFPALTSSAAITAIAIYILNARGLLNSVLVKLGFTHLGLDPHHPWFGISSTALPSIMGLNIWTTSGTMMLFYLASLQSIPPDVYEAAAIDGAGTWRTFRKITFPLLKPGHFFVAVVSVIGALKVFDQAFIVSGGAGGPAYSTLTAVLYLYRTAINDVDFGYAAAIGVVLFVVIFVFTLVQRLLFGRAEIGY